MAVKAGPGDRVGRVGIALAALCLAAGTAVGEAFRCTPSLDFGDVPVGLTRDLTVSCVNERPVSLRFRYDGHSSDFGWNGSIPGVCLGSFCIYDLDRVDPQKNFRIPITLRATGLGPRATSLTIANDGGFESTTVPLTGNGIPASRLPLYALSSGPGSSLLQIDPASGTTLTLTATGANDASDPTVDIEGKRLFFKTGTAALQTLYRIDLETLSVSTRPIGHSQNLAGFRYDPRLGKILALTTAPESSLVGVDPDTGAVTILAHTVATSFSAAAFDRFGRRYFFVSGTIGSQRLFVVDLESLDVTTRDVPRADNYRFLEYDEEEKIVLAITDGQHSPMLAIDPATGTSTIRQEIGLPDISSVTFDPRERRFFVAGGEKDSQKLWTLPLAWRFTEAGSTVRYAGGLAALSYGPSTATPCLPDGYSLCLGGRFRATARFRNDPIRDAAISRPITGDAGAFWFLTANNLELVVKVVDGRAVNGHFWIFGAGLTDLEYDLTIRDSATGRVWVRHSPAGRLESFSDTSTF